MSSFLPILILTACGEGEPPRFPGVLTDGASSDVRETPAPRIVINEVQASNGTGPTDEDGQSVDWIELYNAEPTPVDLDGWWLSDDSDEPEKWAMPALTLSPGQFTLVFASGKDRRRTVASWDTRVDQGDDWRFLAVKEPPPPDWFAHDFDDSAWETGPSGFGQSDEDDATAVWSSTIYVRTEIEVAAADLDGLSSLVLHLDYDDAFVAYLNGVEVARAGIVSDGPPAWDQPATSTHEARLYQGEPPERFDLDGSLDLLTAGANTLAIEVHNAVDSSDTSLVPFLSLGYAEARAGRSSAVLDLAPMYPHTNFSLKSSGERLSLYDPRGREADDVDPVQTLADQSYGRQPDGTEALGYFMVATPGASNTSESRPGFASTPTFSPPPGHHPGGVEVRIDAVGADIHVAWNGTEPTVSDPRYTTPLHTGSDDEAVVLRARAYQDGLWPSRIATATYLLAEPGPLPVVSVVTEPANLFDEETGIYVLGTEYEPEQPNRGANFWEDWERPVHLSAWEPGGVSPAFAVDGGVSIHGGWSRAHDQRNLLIDLRGGYGDDAVEYPVFPDLAASSFTRLLLRAAGNDWLGCFMEGCSEGAHLRDGLMHRLTVGADLDVMGFRPVRTYVNGQYWGTYNLREQPGPDWVAAHYGYEDIDLLEMDGEVVRGDALHYESMLEWMRTNDLADPANYAHVQTLMDVDEYANYLAFEIFYDNGDWPGNNVKYWRPRTADGRWRWLLYDTDHGLGAWWASPEVNTLAVAMADDSTEWPNPGWSTELFRLLLTSPEFTESFLVRYADLLNTLLSPDRTRATLDELVAVVAPEMPDHLARWGEWTDGTTTHTMDLGRWDREIDWIDQWLAERPTHARQHLIDDFRLAGTWTLQLEADPPGAGTFELAAVDVDGPFTGVYFRGVPVTITAVPASGFQFVGWSGADVGADPTVALEPDGPVSLVAQFE
jgi:hypothetical protein